MSASVMAAGWYPPMAKNELDFLGEENARAKLVPLRSLEPYYCQKEDRWTNVLANKKVCVVSSFADTMAKQLLKRNEIWQDDTDSLLPPTTDFHFVRTYYSPKITEPRTAWQQKNWQNAVDTVVKEVIEKKPQIVLIGCGGLAMPIAAELKKQGIVVVVLGGAIQILFGIKGKRWENHDVISKFWNDAWTSPAEDEIPTHAFLVEGGCYWF